MSLVGRFRSIPPVLSPNRFSDILGAFRGGDGEKEIREKICAYLGNGRVLLFRSGRAAMVAAFRAMRKIRDRAEVVLPAYTCFTVPSAVAAAGLRFVPCDVEKENFGIAPRELDKNLSKKTLCVVPTHLYGIPCGIRETIEAARKEGIWILEDAAQALGGILAGRPLGSFGDIGLFSLGRGKNLSTGGGGILWVKHPELASVIEKSAGKPELAPSGRGYRNLAEVVAADFLSRRPFYGLVSVLPGLEIGVSRFDPEIAAGNLSVGQTRLLGRIFGRIDELRLVRARNARLLLEGLADLQGIMTPEIGGDSEPAWLRLPILVPSDKRDLILKSKGSSLGMSASYPVPIHEIPGAGPYRIIRSLCPCAEEIASRILTLPTHPRVSARTVERILDCLREVL
jgi:dTDP-4-amino-4,6-dideoxygalactose transaminase